MKYRTYGELIDTVKNSSNESERKRINEELELFSNRKWEDYILFASNLISEIAGSDIPIVKGLSACDSYLVKKSSCLNMVDSDLLNSSYSREILFNDTLRLEIDACNPWGDHDSTAIFANNAIESCIKESGLYYCEQLLQNKNGIGKELIIISKEPITEADKEIIISEKKTSTEEEKTVLYKYLLLTFLVKVR